MRILILTIAMAIGTVAAIVPAMAEQYNIMDRVSVDKHAIVFSAAHSNVRKCNIKSNVRLPARIVSGHRSSNAMYEVEIGQVHCRVRGAPVLQHNVRGWVYEGLLRLVSRAPGPPKLENLPLATNALQFRAKVNQDHTEIRADHNNRAAERCMVNEHMTVDVQGEWHYGWKEVIVLNGQQRGCIGWIHDSRLNFIPLPEVTGTGKWGDVLPVFKNREAFFKARNALKHTGTYPDSDIVCKTQTGTKLEFKPFRDLGVGEAKFNNCEGWVDRELIK